MDSYVIEKCWVLLAAVRHSLKQDSTGTSRLASNGDLGRVSSESFDVRLNPPKSKTLI